MRPEVRALLLRVRDGDRSWGNPDPRDPANDAEGERQLALYQEAETNGWLTVNVLRQSMRADAIYKITGTITPEGEQALG